MNARSSNDLQEMARQIPGLLFECPAGGNPPDCPLHAIRKLPYLERVQWAKSMSEEQLLEVYQFHKSCLAIKEAGQAS